MNFADYFSIYVTAPDKDGNMKYFEYNMLEDRLLEISEYTYKCYRESGAWSNLVPDETCLREMLNIGKNIVKVKEIKNA